VRPELGPSASTGSTESAKADIRASTKKKMRQHRSENNKPPTRNADRGPAFVPAAITGVGEAAVELGIFDGKEAEEGVGDDRARHQGSRAQPR